jgi:hypothetical protein
MATLTPGPEDAKHNKRRTHHLGSAPHGRSLALAGSMFLLGVCTHLCGGLGAA